MAKDQGDRDRLKENLRAVDDGEGGFAARLSNEVNNSDLLMDEMEQKRRIEEQFKGQQERIARKFQGENARENKADDELVAEEVQKLADGTVFDPYSEHVAERQRL